MIEKAECCLYWITIFFLEHPITQLPTKSKLNLLFKLLNVNLKFAFNLAGLSYPTLNNPALSYMVAVEGNICAYVYNISTFEKC